MRIVLNSIKFKCHSVIDIGFVRKNMVNHWDIYIFILKILIIRIVLNSIKFKRRPVIGFRFGRKKCSQLLGNSHSKF